MPQLASGRTWLALLILLSAGVFAVGVAVERSTVHQDVHGALPTASGKASDAGTDEAATSAATDTHDAGNTAPGESSTAGETIFGFDTESTGLVVSVVAFSVVLAFAVWFWGWPVLFLVAVAFGLGAAVFDARETIHQVQEGRGLLVFLAGLTGLLHLGLAVVALRVYQSSREQASLALSQV